MNDRLSPEELFTLLEALANQRNHPDELSFERPDPLLIARRSPDPRHALVCALLSYGQAKSIVKCLDHLQTDIWEMPEEKIIDSMKGLYYRFQTSYDIAQMVITIKRATCSRTLEEIFCEGYEKEGRVVEGLATMIGTLLDVNTYRSPGYDFLTGRIPLPHNPKGSAQKRWHMYLRWMVRRDWLDMGLWSKVKTKDLLLPLDTHTFRLSRHLGLLARKSCDLGAVYEVTKVLQGFCPDDPVKYDFALYRLGQEKGVLGGESLKLLS